MKLILFLFAMVGHFFLLSLIAMFSVFSMTAKEQEGFINQFMTHFLFPLSSAFCFFWIFYLIYRYWRDSGSFPTTHLLIVPGVLAVNVLFLLAMVWFGKGNP
ncbi:MAG: hypothetical protein AAF203_06910 [Pseudomonadota bacterium]